MINMRSAYKILAGRHKSNGTFGRRGCAWNDNIKMDGK
jgi:hypothetical protein